MPNATMLICRSFIVVKTTPVTACEMRVLIEFYATARLWRVEIQDSAS